MESIIDGIIKKVSQKNQQAKQCVIENVPVDGYKTKKKLITALDKSKPKTKQKVIDCLEEKGSDNSPVKKLFAKAKKVIKGKRGQTNAQRQMLLDKRIKYVENELNRPLTNNELSFVRPSPLTRQTSAERLNAERLQGFQEEAWQRLVDAQKYMEMVEKDKEMNKAASLLQKNLKAYSSAKKESTRNKREQEVVDSTKKVDDILKKKGISVKQALQGETNKETGKVGKSKMKQAKKVKIPKKPKEVLEVVLPEEDKPVKFTPKVKKPKKDKPIKKIKEEPEGSVVIEPNKEPPKVKFTPKVKKPKKDKPIKKIKEEPEGSVVIKTNKEVEKEKLKEEKKRLREEKEAEKKRVKEEKEAEKKRLKEEKEAEKKRLKEEKEAEKKRLKEEKEAEKVKEEASSSEESTESEPTESEPEEVVFEAPTEEEILKGLVDTYLSSREKGIPKFDSALLAVKSDDRKTQRENTLLLAKELGIVVPGMAPVDIIMNIGRDKKADAKFEKLNERLVPPVPVAAPAVPDPRAAEDTTGSGRFVINRGFVKVSVPHPMNTKDL